MKINYKDVMDLGFEREPFGPDSVYFNEYGYQPFLVTKKLHKNFIAEWDCADHTVEIVKYKKYNVLARLRVDSLEDLKVILNFISAK